MTLNGKHVNQSPSQRTFTGRLAGLKAPLGTVLTRLGGGDPRILSRVPSARGRFIQMGLVLLSTAALAVVSMAFALVDGLRVSWWFAVPLGIGWGFVILNIDRMLIQNIRPGFSGWRLVGVIAPRLVVAALLGVVIATPLVLHIFASEIDAQMRRTNAQAAIELGATRQNGPEAKRLEEVKAAITRNEGILAGDLPGLTSPNIQAATEQLTRAEADLEKKRAAANAAYLKMRCELDGYKCADGSGKKGPGPRYEAAKKEHNVAVADLEGAKQAVAAARGALSTANKEAAESNKAKLAEAQTRARAELPALVTERDKLQRVVDGVTLEDGKVQAGSVGLLAQLEALDQLGEESSMAELAHWAVAGLFFMIELLPVLVKVLNSVGRPSLYDRISELEEKSTYDDAIQRRNQDRRRIEGDSKKRRDIEDDMRKRETELGVKANAHVASEMEKILDLALRQWSANVTNTLHGAAHGQPNPGGTPSAASARSAPTAPTAPTVPTTPIPPVAPATNGFHGQPVSPGGGGQPGPSNSAGNQAIRSRFNLPNGGSTL